MAFYDPPLDPKSDYVIYEWYLNMIQSDTVRDFDSHYERYIAIHQSLNMQKREYAVVS